MKILVTPGPNGLISNAGQIIGQPVSDAAVIVDVDSTSLPASSAARVTDAGQVEIVANHIGSGPWFDQQASTADRLTPIEITELGVTPASTWAMTPRAETTAEVTARESAAAGAAAAAEAVRIATLEVPRYAALVALLGAGITEAAILDQLALISNATEREARRLYFNRPTWRRNSDFIAWGKTAFSLTDAQIDALFVAADAID